MPKYRVTLPIGMGVQDWAFAVSLDLSALGTTGTLADPSQWQKWALGVVQIAEISALAPPNPMEFNDWQPWADRFVDAVA